ncbi:hypothetical protein [Apilactobacillus quenuiae]|uniref:hypothetical protein n=1 Tax=Apilactobacillus quenuiae TaxID=2008377 RepID=UPI000D0135B9|nr:hypothetical protein [Apilactobacillus quenuiae]
MIYAIISFIAGYIMFVFCLFQGVLDMSAQINEIHKAENSSKKFKAIRTGLWMIPPLKIILERNRLRNIVKSSGNSKEDAERFKKFYDISNQSTAWAYISFACMLDSIVSIKTVFDAFRWHLTLPLFSVLSLIVIIAGYAQVMYRASDDREEKLSAKINRLGKQ